MEDKFKLSERAKRTLESAANFPITSIEIADISELITFRKVSCEIAESFDNMIMKKVIEIAREQGLTDLWLINKEFVVEALKREVERRRVENERQRKANT